MPAENNILYGGPEPEYITDGSKSLGEYSLRHFQENGDKVVLIDGVTGEELTSSQLLLRSIQLAKALQAFGIKSGDTVGLCSENKLEVPIVMYATFYLGATVAPINSTYLCREIEHAFSLSKPKIIFASSNTEKNVNKFARNSKYVKKVVVFGEGTTNVNTLQKFVKDIELNSNFNCKPVDINENIALILCSSGTTGLPKGVQLTQANIIVGIGQQLARNFLTDLQPVMIGIVPWFHVLGCGLMLGVAVAGAQMIALPKFQPDLFLGTIEKYKVNVLIVVPPIMVFLAKHPAVDKYDLSSLLVIGCGAAALGKDTIEAVRSRVGVYLILQGYGMSESTLAILSQDIQFSKPGSVGTLRAGMWGKVIDTDTGKILGPNESGEILFKGSLVMKGYIGNSEATKDTIDSDGWLHTGDIGYYDEDREWFIVDRLKELIKYKGYQVPPAEIEDILLSHPCIEDAGVIGVANEAVGELPFAFVVKKPDADVSEIDIIDYVAKRASPAKRLHGGVRFINEIPKTASGKILRRELRDLVKNQKSKL